MTITIKNGAQAVRLAERAIEALKAGPYPVTLGFKQNMVIRALLEAAASEDPNRLRSLLLIEDCTYSEGRAKEFLDSLAQCGVIASHPEDDLTSIKHTG